MRPAVVLTALGIALAVAAPTAWALTRPAATAGVPVEQVLGSPPASSSGTAPAVRASPPARPPPLPRHAGRRRCA